MIQPDNNLLKRYLDGSCSEKEQAFIEEWLEADPSHAMRLEYIAAERTVQHDIDFSAFNEQVLQEIEQREDTKNDKVYPVQLQASSPATHWHWVAAAVILLISTVAGVYLYQTSISAPRQPVFVTKAMPAGKVATLTLSDGSTVKLNSGSSIRYPKRFTGATRDVFLSGEAFFQVARDTTKPFKIHAGNLTTKVLGTAFNVKAFDDDSTVQVAVTEGKVAVQPDTKTRETVRSTDRKLVMLEANQWATYDRKGQIFKKRSGDISRMIAWKKGILRFDQQPISRIARQLERWYGVDIQIENPRLAECTISGTHKDENLENVLEAIQFTTDMEYKMQENQVILTGECK